MSTEGAVDLNQTNIVPAEHPELFKNLQGNILNGHGRDFARHIFVSFKAGKESLVKSWMHSFSTTFVTSAAQQELQSKGYKHNRSLNDLFVNLYLSSLAYEYLGFTDLTQVPADQSFRQGMANRKAELSDPPVDSWEPGFSSNNLHAMVLLASDDEVKLNAFVKYICAELEQISEIHAIEKGKVVKNEAGHVVEHFGFVDGVSNPLYLKRKIEAAGPTDKYDPSAPLSLVLTKDIHGGPYAYGSYVVYRKLSQNVDGWNKEVASLASKLGIEPALAGAYAVGRFQDGTPLTDSGTPLGESRVPNNFNFEGDPGGVKCPMHAHIRKSNPRGQTTELFPGTSIESERAHRITRRAIGYGESRQPSDSNRQPTTTGDVGLLFICMQSSIVDQFDFIQASWANANQFIKQKVGQDPVIGQATQSPSDGQSYPNQWGDETANFSRFYFKLFITMKGGEYFFAPSIEFLQTV